MPASQKGFETVTEQREKQEQEQEYGEGNYKAGREYQEAVTRTSGTKKSERAAKAAKKALEDPETRRELEEAERIGKSRAGKSE
jgi:hypothetical protein